MKKSVSIIVSALFLSGLMYAGVPENVPSEGEDGVSIEQIVKSRTAEMVETYGLSESQATQLEGLNNHYAGKIPSLSAAPDMNSMPDFSKMGQADMQEMASNMEKMQSSMEEMQRNEESYEEALKAILDKKQMKSYTKDKKREQMRQQQEMQAMFQRNFSGDDFGGGFGGGSFGGFGGGFAMGF